MLGLTGSVGPVNGSVLVVVSPGAQPSVAVVVVESALVVKAHTEESVVPVVSGTPVVVGVLLNEVEVGGVVGTDGCVDGVGVVETEVDELGVEGSDDEGVVVMVVGDCVGRHDITWLAPYGLSLLGLIAAVNSSGNGGVYTTGATSTGPPLTIMTDAFG